MGAAVVDEASVDFYSLAPIALFHTHPWEADPTRTYYLLHRSLNLEQSKARKYNRFFCFLHNYLNPLFSICRHFRDFDPSINSVAFDSNLSESLFRPTKPPHIFPSITGTPNIPANPSSSGIM